MKKKEQLKAHEAKMQKTLDVLAKELAAVRRPCKPGSARQDHRKYYGAPTPLNQVAAISTPLIRARWQSSRGTARCSRRSRRRFRSPIWASIRRTTAKRDPPVLPAADRGAPQGAHQKGRVKTGEEAKVALRNIRRDAMDKFKSAQKKSEITEDELHEGEDKLQKLTDKYVKEVDAMVAKKSRSLQKFNCCCAYKASEAISELPVPGNRRSVPNDAAHGGWVGVKNPRACRGFLLRRERRC